MPARNFWKGYLNKIWLFLVLLSTSFVSPICSALEFNKLEINNEQGLFHLTMNAVLSAPRDKVYTVLTDYEKYYQLNDIMTQSHVIGTADDSVSKIHIMIESCILLICGSVRLVETVTEYPPEKVIARVVSKESDFSEGRSIWVFESLQKNKTQVSLDCTFRPSFWYPPIIGPAIIRHKMKNEFKVLFTRTEQLANAT